MSSNYLYKLSEKFLFSTKTNCPKKQQHCKGVYFSEKWILANYLFKECHPASKQSNENFPTDSCSPNDWVKKNSMSKGETLAWEMDCVNLTLYLCVFACLHFNCITENPNTYKSKKKKNHIMNSIQHIHHAVSTSVNTWSSFPRYFLHPTGLFWSQSQITFHCIH